MQRQLWCRIELYEVDTLAVDGWAVSFGTARRGLAHPSTASVPITVLLYNGPLHSAVLMCILKGYRLLDYWVIKYIWVNSHTIGLTGESSCTIQQITGNSDFSYTYIHNIKPICKAQLSQANRMQLLYASDFFIIGCKPCKSYLSINFTSS